MFILAVISLGLFLFKWKTDNSRLKASGTLLSLGERIGYFDLIGVDGTNVDEAALNAICETISVILIFEQPCSICNKNRGLWDKIGKIKSPIEINVYGVILDELESIERFSNMGAVDFNVYSPIDLNQFKNSFQIRSKLSQTIIYRNNKIVYLKVGDLDVEDFFKIKKTIQQGDET